MKFTYNWLRDFVDTPLSPDEIAAKLPMAGFEVEAVASVIPDFDGILVGEVLSCVPHPKSEKLKLCQVDIGDDKLEVVCGAPNVAAKQYVVVAPPGSILPNGLRLEAKSILGIDSQGMICSENELGLSDEDSEILTLDNPTDVGKYFRDVIEQDWVFDIDVTPNRPDMLGIIGIAREVGLLTGTPMNKPTIRLKESGSPIDKLIKILIKDPVGCPRYAARVIQNIEVKPSPSWMKRRLHAIGLRSISNLVDVTNYVMMETGQPLHAFDYDWLEKKKIVVQRAQNGEPFQTLDEREHKLTESDLLICDGTRSVGLAGVMGGLNTEVSDATKNVLIECAYFDPLTVRRTAKKLGIPSDASKRFERGTDPNGIPYAIKRATQLMHATAGGEIAKGVADAYPARIRPAKVNFRPKRAALVVGDKIPARKMEKIFTGLECKVNKKTAEWQITTPTFRPDLTREVDLIEEVARVHGYDYLPEKTHSQISVRSTFNPQEELIEKIRETMTGLGFDEAVTFDLTSQKQAGMFLAEGNEVLPLVNTLTDDLSVMRSSVIATLLHSLAYNINRKNRDAWLYEIGSTFWKTSSQPLWEEQHLCGLTAGASETHNWSDQSRPVNIHDTRGFIEDLVERLRLPGLTFSPFDRHNVYELGWIVELDGQSLGAAGKLKSAILDNYEIDAEVYGFEIDLTNLHTHLNRERKYQRVPRFPAIERDLAIVVDRAIPAEKIFSIIRSVSGSYLEHLELFDLYTGKQIEQGKKSLAFALTFRAPDRTLTDELVEGWQKNILDQLAQECEAELRA